LVSCPATSVQAWHGHHQPALTEQHFATCNQATHLAGLFQAQDTRYHSCWGQMGFFAQRFRSPTARHAAACRSM
jgi:hypothetical protein